MLLVFFLVSRAEAVNLLFWRKAKQPLTIMSGRENDPMTAVTNIKISNLQEEHHKERHRLNDTLGTKVHEYALKDIIRQQRLKRVKDAAARSMQELEEEQRKCDEEIRKAALATEAKLKQEEQRVLDAQAATLAARASTQRLQRRTKYLAGASITLGAGAGMVLGRASFRPKPALLAILEESGMSLKTAALATAGIAAAVLTSASRIESQPVPIEPTSAGADAAPSGSRPVPTEPTSAATDAAPKRTPILIITGIAGGVIVLVGIVAGYCAYRRSKRTLVTTPRYLYF